MLFVEETPGPAQCHSKMRVKPNSWVSGCRQCRWITAYFATYFGRTRSVLSRVRPALSFRSLAGSGAANQNSLSFTTRQKLVYTQQERETNENVLSSLSKGRGSKVLTCP